MTFSSLFKPKLILDPYTIQKNAIEKLPTLLNEAGFNCNKKTNYAKLFIGSYSKIDLELLDYIQSNFTNLDKITVFDIAQSKKHIKYYDGVHQTPCIKFNNTIITGLTDVKKWIDSYMNPYKKLKLKDVPQFTRYATYKVDMPWSYLEKWLNDLKEQFGDNLQLDPDFQRNHVWDQEKQIKYVEYILRGGLGSKTILWNCPGWQKSNDMGPMVLVDGKQRLEAVRKFLRNELPVFGHFLNEYHDKPRDIICSFSMNINDLETRYEVLMWYIDVNDGGVAHTKEEIEKVRKLALKESHNERT